MFGRQSLFSKTFVFAVHKKMMQVFRKSSIWDDISYKKINQYILSAAKILLMCGLKNEEKKQLKKKKNILLQHG